LSRRGRLIFEAGNVNIHTVSALSIERVRRPPVRIKIWMNNSAGVFQIRKTLDKRISHSCLKGREVGGI